MEKYAVLSAVARGNFWERLCHLYMKTGDYVDMENLENRHIVYVKVFLSDIRNQCRSARVAAVARLSFACAVFRGRAGSA